MLKRELGHCAKGANIETPVKTCTIPANIFLYENVNIRGYSMYLISPSARFIMKKNSRVAQGLTVVTTNHQTPPMLGAFYEDTIRIVKNNVEKDVIVEEDVWLGANVTLLAGVVIGRGSIIGAGAICCKSIPPYAIAVGSPAKVIRFKFSPEEIIEHEKALYPENERLPLDLLVRNYDKYWKK
jgi:acetyltransferase-like isoleucine patch superfamily enzyme